MKKNREMSMNIQLKPFTDSDLTLFVNWLHSEHIQRWYAPVEAWIDEVSKRESEYSWIRHYIILAEETPIGFCQYYPYWRSGEDWQGSIPVEETYSIDYLIGEVDFLRKGCACQALKLLQSLIFALPNGQRIIAQPDEDNLASRQTLLAAGYTYDEENELFIVNR
ncbi:GNAT family N-acetyltransferase [Desulfosporosinus nitroreducens]|uniref:Acetyltransferase n=1 Tax=Desulfosporosinus nitroreducens TaxID=2018668 RepID=A0ABT8QMR9_9FIRM|nr:GNAT family N-acetyltransferase [Desulfosporosinus nitroreducens]MDO0822638.1 acetyltransferase [Desulfosporosinus nitroreducens]